MAVLRVCGRLFNTKVIHVSADVYCNDPMFDWPGGLKLRDLGHIPKPCLNAAYLRCLAQSNCFICVNIRCG